MAVVRLPDGREFTVNDCSTSVLDHYRSEGAEVLVEQLPDGEFATDDGQMHEHPGYGEPLTGVEAPADGTAVEISSDDELDEDK